MPMRNQQSSASSTSSISLQELASHPSYPSPLHQSQSQHEEQTSTTSGRPNEERNTPQPSTSDTPRREPFFLRRVVNGVANFWETQVSCEVEFSACRDHLALERTYLGYLRTSVTLAMIGTGVAQLFTINESDSGFGYTSVGRPLAAACFTVAIATLILGTVRTWRYQYAMIHGRALASGFEVHIVGIAVSLLLLVFLGFLLTIDLLKTEMPEASPDD